MSGRESILRLRAIWFFYLGGFGAVFPYMSVYLKEVKGLGEGEVGLVLSALPLASLVARPIWGTVSDVTGRRSHIIAALCLVAGLLFWVFGRAEGFLPLVAGMLGAAFFAGAVVPLVTAASFASLGAASQELFGGVRLWGTVGFLIGMELVGSVPRLSPLSGEPLLGTAPFLWVAAGGVVMAGVVSLGLPARGDLAVRAKAREARGLLRSKNVLLVLGAAFLMHLAIQGPVQHLAILLRDLGGNVADIRNTWRGMLLIEIPLVGFSGRLTQWLGARGLVRLGLAAEAVRWSVTAWAPGLLSVEMIQGLHGVGIAGIFLGMPLLLESRVPAHLRSSAQAYLATVGTGLGAVFSNQIFGALLERVGPRPPLFASAGLCAFLVVLLSRRFSRRG